MNTGVRGAISAASVVIRNRLYTGPFKTGTLGLTHMVKANLFKPLLTAVPPRAAKSKSVAVVLATSKYIFKNQ